MSATYLSDFRQYDVVRLTKILHAPEVQPGLTNRRPPKVGDVACIIEIYTAPPGFALECTDNEEHHWLNFFGPNDLEVALVESGEKIRRSN